MPSKLKKFVRILTIASFFLIAQFFTALIQPIHAQSSTITLNPGTRYQTITGWEANAGVGLTYTPAFTNYIGPLLNKTVNEAGINRVRLEIRSGGENSQDVWALYRQYEVTNGQCNLGVDCIDYQTYRCLRYSTINDNGDPNSTNVNGYKWSQIDDAVDNVVAPMRALIAANGEQLYINLTYVAFTDQMKQPQCPAGLQYIHSNPSEYAEFILATFQHLDTKYGFVPDSVEVILEPNLADTYWKAGGTSVGNNLVAAAQRLAANGYTPDFIAPSSSVMPRAQTDFDEMVANVPATLQYLTELSYHCYWARCRDDNNQLIQMGSRGTQNDIGTSMLEWWPVVGGDPSYQVLHKGLKLANNSSWQQDAIRGVYNVDDTNPTN